LDDKFSQLMSLRFFEMTGKVPNSEALKNAVRLLEARAHYQGDCHEVHVRIAEHDDSIYLELGDENWRCVEIGPKGWKLVSDPPVRFRRPKGMKALPIPKIGGSIEDLAPFVNVASKGNFVLMVCWLVAALVPSSSYPILILEGEQGSAKSTAAMFLRNLIDPNFAPHRGLPRKEDDLHIAAMNSHVLAFDNISKLPQWLSDAFCRIATGAGQGTRQYYTNEGEVLFSAVRPLILNGIEHFVEREDLAERSLVIPLRAIPEDQRRPMDDLTSAFDQARPRILGTLLDLVSHALRGVSELHSKWMPRMADFGRISMSCETAIWPQGTFKQAFLENQADAVEDALDADQVATMIRRLLTQTMQTMQTHNSQDKMVVVSGTATQLLAHLNKLREECGEKADANWPKNGHVLSNRLRRAEPFLRKVGIDIERTKKGHGHNRIIDIVISPPGVAKKLSASSASSALNGPALPFAQEAVPIIATAKP
jgi:hypothetical protein